MNSAEILSLDRLKYVVGKPSERYRKIRWHSVDIYVKKTLTMAEYMDVVDHIVSDCRAEDGEPLISLIDFATKLNIIMAYSLIELPKDMNLLWHIIYDTDLYETVCEQVNAKQVDSIIKSISLYF